MPPIERARRLSRSLQAGFRIDLFSARVERDFERHLERAILAAEREAFQRGREAALGQSRENARETDRDAVPVLDGASAALFTGPQPRSSADAPCSTTA